jgi:AcrR family transcriptional regulator
MTTRRQQLLDRSLRYLLDHGIADLSLRPLAARIGTSARLLIYHFGSRDGLLTAVMDEVRARLQASFTAMSQRTVTRRTSPLEVFWQWATAADQVAYIRLLFEVQVLALQRPAEFGPYLARTSDTGSPPSSRRCPRRSATRKPRRSVRPSSTAAAEFLSTGDRKRTTRALNVFRTFFDRKAGGHDRHILASRRHTVITLLIVAAVTAIGLQTTSATSSAAARSGSRLGLYVGLIAVQLLWVRTLRGHEGVRPIPRPVFRRPLDTW